MSAASMYELSADLHRLSDEALHGRLDRAVELAECHYEHHMTRMCALLAKAIIDREVFGAGAAAVNTALAGMLDICRSEHEALGGLIENLENL